jgi:hypothetical protein
MEPMPIRTVKIHVRFCLLHVASSISISNRLGLQLLPVLKLIHGINREIHDSTGQVGSSNAFEMNSHARCFNQPEANCAFERSVNVDTKFNSPTCSSPPAAL